MTTILAYTSLTLAAVTCLLFLRNLFVYRHPAKSIPKNLPPVSVLIPARNEERSIGAAITSVLGSEGLRCEVVVLDDGSSDGTGQIVSGIAAADSRVRLISGPVLPSGWCGKQHACSVLANHANYSVMCFMDADVRLAPDALARVVAFMQGTGAALVTGFPFQLTGTFLERLVIPLIHFVLLGFLPMDGLRRTRHAAFAAGCGQLMLVRRGPYRKAGGHAAIRTTLHDGLNLPRRCAALDMEQISLTQRTSPRAGCIRAHARCGSVF